MNIFIDTEDMEERYGEELYKEYLEKENNRLNNIINELEKIFEKEDYQYLQRKLKELKEEK